MSQTVEKIEKKNLHLPSITEIYQDDNKSISHIKRYDKWPP